MCVGGWLIVYNVVVNKWHAAGKVFVLMTVYSFEDEVKKQTREVLRHECIST